MKTTIEITNEEKYAEKVADVDTDSLKSKETRRGCEALGDISIELADGSWLEITGEHGAYDYEEDYGFILKHVS